MPGHTGVLDAPSIMRDHEEAIPKPPFSRTLDCHGSELIAEHLDATLI
jgi:hypothetical protein